MAIENVASNATYKSSGSGFGIFSIFKYVILSLVFGIMLMNAIILSIEGNSIEPGVKYLGLKFTTVTNNLQIHSQQIIDQGGLWVSNDSIGSNLWQLIKYLWNISNDLLIIYTWLLVLAWIAKKAIVFDDSKTTSAWLIAIILFMLLQFIFILAFTNENMMVPINAFITFGKSLPYIIKPVTKIFETI
jgi:hypothetical protein